MANGVPQSSVPSLRHLAAPVAIKYYNQNPHHVDQGVLRVVNQDILKPLWDELKKTYDALSATGRLKPFGLTDIMTNIEESFEGELRQAGSPICLEERFLDNRVHELFTRLAETFFSTHTIPVNLLSYARLQQQLEDDALLKIWYFGRSESGNLTDHFVFNGPKPTTLKEVKDWFANPENTPQLAYITELYLVAIDLMALPSEISKFTNLRCLDLSNNRLRSIPSHLNLPYLNNLFLTNNHIRCIPARLEFLPRLKMLDLRENQLTAFPNLNFPQLEELFLSDNQIQSMPNELKLPFDNRNRCLLGLASLFSKRGVVPYHDLSWWRGIDSGAVTSHVNALSLTELTWMFCLLSNDPEDCSVQFDLPLDQLHLPIKSLSLNKNQLRSIPAGLNFPYMTELSVNDNLISSILPGINSPYLRRLYINNNLLASLPSHLSDLSQLIALGLDNNLLCSVSAELSLPQLTVLYLNGNQLGSIPPTINLPQLKKLHAIGNRLSGIPTNPMPELKELRLSNNPLSSIPAVSLLKLEEFSLDNSQVDTISAELSFPALKKFSVKNNKLSSLPNSLALPNLEEFYLDNNNLDSFPGKLNLSKLRVLSLNNNQIKKVFELSLSQLERLYLHTNPLDFFSTDLNLRHLKELDLRHTLLPSYEYYGIMGTYSFINIRVLMDPLPENTLNDEKPAFNNAEKPFRHTVTSFALSILKRFSHLLLGTCRVAMNIFKWLFGSKR